MMVKNKSGKLKCQTPKLKTRYLVFVIWIYFVICDLPFVIAASSAKEITILYTGDTHAMLYPCNCLKEPDGGVARRAALIKRLKKSNADTLVLDSGGFFAGGGRDQYSQNTELDRARTLVNLKAMELMRYDVVAIGDDEFNFGKDFLQQHIASSGLVFLSANIKFDKVTPYTIKEVAGTKIGIIGVTAPSAAQKAGGLEVGPPEAAVKSAVQELKKKGASIVVLLSHLGDSEDRRLLNEVKDIDILVVGYSRKQEEPPTNKIGQTLVLRPSWQGRHLGKLTLIVKDNKITNYKTEDLRLSDKIRDDAEIMNILPNCFSETDCRKKGFVGICQDPGTLNSRCFFTEPAKAKLLVIVPKSCVVCDTKMSVNYLNSLFPGVVISYLYYPDAKSEKLIRELGINGLPTYLLEKEIEREKGFDNLRENVERKGDFYIIKPEASGISYFINRKRIKGKLDLFISLFDNSSKAVLETLREFNPGVHFLTAQEGDRFEAARGNLEVEECLRSVCVQKYYPEYFWDYITCRAGNINSSWWEDCLSKFNPETIKTCAQGQEGRSLLKDNISLNRELVILFGPVYLLDNQEVCSSQGVPSKEELKRILKR